MMTAVGCGCAFAFSVSMHKAGQAKRANIPISNPQAYMHALTAAWDTTP